MKKVIGMVCAVLLSGSVNALEIADINLADKAQVANVALQLNGAGVRSKFFFKLYVAGLYLSQKQTIADNILADSQPHRFVLHMLREISNEKLLDAFNDAIKDNHTPAELAAINVQLTMLTQIFSATKEIKVGDVIFLDYLPGSGTRISINGATQGMIPGPTFNRALLKIWIGNKPVQDDLKSRLLGG